MGIRGFFFKTQTSPDAEPRPSRLWEITHPRRAEALYARMADEFDLRAEEDINQVLADARYREWADDDYHRGKPPDSDARDSQLAQLAGQYPEVSALETEQRECEAEEYDRGGSWTYPQHEGPGFTEPPLNWVGPGEHDGWTFTQWAEERGYDPELVDEINREFPPYERELACARWWEERETREEYAAPAGREVPMHREIRGQADPYDDWTPWTQYWAQGIEGAE